VDRDRTYFGQESEGSTLYGGDERRTPSSVDRAGRAAVVRRRDRHHHAGSVRPATGTGATAPGV